MRPHRLKVTAFGAFAGPQEVRFDDLDGLFLLHGETGAGKTTLLDAIAFALYGQVPGVRGDARRLRSDHAAPDVLTEVQLEATIGGRRLRITRRPEQARPKKAGTGFTREPASIVLEEGTPAGTWEGRSPRVGEADKEIIDLMGMSAAQFFQVVLLPQGQFAKFLHSDAKERAALLQKLFGTDRFQAVERWLADRRVVTQRDVEAVMAEVDQLLALVAQGAGVAKPDGSGPGDGAGRVADGAGRADEAASGVSWQVAWAGRLLESARAEQEAAATVATARGQESDEAQTALTAVVQLADRQRRRADALRRQVALRAEAPSIEALHAELDAGRRAAEVAPVLDEARRAVELTAKAAKSARAARAIIPADMAEATADELRAAAQQQQERLGRLEQLRPVARQAADEEQAAGRARQRAASLETDVAMIIARGEQLRASRPAAERGRDASGQASLDLPTALGTAQRLRRIATDCAALARARGTQGALRGAHLTAREQAVGLKEEAHRLREARIDGMRAELAAALVDGTPCPVCGSLDHPELCELTGEQVSREQEQAAVARADQATAEADEVGQRLAAAEAVIEGLASRLSEAGFTKVQLGLPAAAGDAPAAPADLSALPESLLAGATRRAEAEAAAAEDSAAALGDVAAGLKGAQLALDDLDAALTEAVRKQAELSQQQEAALAEAASAGQRAAGCRATLFTLLGEAADLDAAMATAKRLAEVLARAADAVDEEARTAAHSREAGERAIQAAAGAGFSEGAVGAGFADPYAAVTAARAAMRDQAWRKSAEQRIREHEASAEAVAGLLADPDLAVEPEPPAPVEAAREAVAVARRAHEKSVGAHDVAEAAVAQLDQLAPQLAGAVAAVGPLVARAAQARQLADLVNANGTVNQYKMTLSSFVLAARLEEVAAAASQRLLRMTAGRYSLAHTDSGKGARKAGLGLLACDSWTGQDRDTSTLSGGETFLASLALALGLADVVTAEAAGTPMEALFVDEGFGTLDEDTLDEVMTVLDGLREGGRMVGIVSHVSELRQRIPARIHVHKGHHGSSVSVTAG
jgi:exonuclease SbcC